MKVNRFGRASILTPPQINLLFNEGFTKPRDRALFGVCLYAATRINEACTLLRGDVIGVKGVRDVLVIRVHNTKGKQSTREIQVHPQLKEYLEEHHRTAPWHTRPYLFPVMWICQGDNFNLAQSSLSRLEKIDPLAFKTTSTTSHSRSSS